MSVKALAALRRFAEGERIAELSLQHYATSAHVTTVTTARADGSIDISTTTGHSPVIRLVRGGDASAMRDAARILLESGFPRIAPPPGPPPPPTVPPVRIAVRTSALDSIAAEVSAAQLDAVPAFARAVYAVAELGAPARRAVDEATRALDTLAGIDVEVRFVPDSKRDRSFGLRLAGGVLSESERDLGIARTVGLGPTTADERKAIANALRDAGFPRGHGSHRPIEGPHHVLSVHHRDVAVITVSDADSPGAAIRALYDTAIRFGMRPLGVS